MAGYRLANYQGANGARAGIIIGDLVFDAAAKVDLARVVTLRAKIDGKRLLRFEWHEKLNGSNASEVATLPPLKQCCEYFVEDYDPRYERCVGKMSWQAGMIGMNCAAHFKGHSRILRPSSAQATEGNHLRLPACPESDVCSTRITHRHHHCFSQMRHNQRILLFVEAQNLEVMTRVSRHQTGINQIADNRVRTH